MKKLIILSGLMVFLLTSCYHSDEPVYNPIANFSVDYDLVIPNELVTFFNNSVDAESYQWDFGDGTFSNEVSPSHSYSQEGNYTVRLSAINQNKVNYATMVVTVYETTLEIQVIEYTYGDYIVNADVTLYLSWYDWENLSNPVISAKTDENGIVVFKGLQTRSYYIDAWSTIADNEAIAYEDVNFIKTLPLEYACHNTFTAYVDYVPVSVLKSAEDRSSDNRVRKQPVIKEIKRSFKDQPAFKVKK